LHRSDILVDARRAAAIAERGFRDILVNRTSQSRGTGFIQGEATIRFVCAAPGACAPALT